MDRRIVILSGLAIAAGGKTALAQPAGPSSSDDVRVPGPAPAPDQGPPGPAGPERAPPPPEDRHEEAQGPGATGPRAEPAQTYSRHEILDRTSDFFGVAAENIGGLIERIFKDNGRPTAYIAGTEGSGAFFFGARYGQGLMYMKDRPVLKVYWQGPTGGFDWGANGSRVFTLCFNLQYPDAIFRRFPGVEGSAYLIGGLGVNYQRADDITLAPIRAGGGLRIGANVGYLAYSRKRNIIPL